MTLAAVFVVALSAGCGSTNANKQTPITPVSQPTQNSRTNTTEKPGATGKSSTSQTSAPVLSAAQQRGELVFKKMYCIGCHAGGNNAMMPDRPIKGAAFKQKYKDDAVLEATIRKGFPDEGMPAFEKEQLSESQMKDLILYIRSFTPTK